MRDIPTGSINPEPRRFRNGTMASGAKTGEGNGGQEDEDEFLKWNMSDHSLGIFVFVSYKLAIPVYF